MKMKLFPTSSIAQIDRYTIENEPVSEIDLMERAALCLYEHLLVNRLSGKVNIFCGPGNNGGDGLALARMLATTPKQFQVTVFLFTFDRNLSPSAETNLERLSSFPQVKVISVLDIDELPHFNNSDTIIDALFGSGLNRPLSGLPALVVQKINNSGAKVLAVDIPSGLMGEDNRNNLPDNIIRATHTYTFQFPKISFLFPENSAYVGELTVLDIGLHPEAIAAIPSSFNYITVDDCKLRFRHRAKFSHKGTYGHALLVAGAYGKMGAAILAAKACLRTGVGLLTLHVPHKTYPIIQTALPEAMCDIDDSDLMFTGVNSLASYSAIGIGPAIGQKVNAQRGVHRLLNEANIPLVIDADAINILGLNPGWLNNLPGNSILTPHPREFERIAGPSASGYERMVKASVLAVKLKIIVVVKGAHSIIASPDGDIWFNSNGNPGMATAGSGDVLTGIILGLLSQGYSPKDAALLGVFFHGMAGDFAKQRVGMNALIASDIIDNLGTVFKKFE